MAKLKQFICLIFVAVLFNGCKKKSDTQQPVDLSEQWIIDGLGNLVFGYADGQWQSKTFSSREQTLFNSLDTADLSATTKPGAVLENTLNYNSVFPNPFVSGGGERLHLGFSPGYSGQFVLKLVYVDSLMVPYYKTAIRVQANAYPPPVPSSTSAIAIHPSTPIGRFRLYYTLSSAGNPHFYKSWGNIQRAQ